VFVLEGLGAPHRKRKHAAPPQAPEQYLTDNTPIPSPTGNLFPPYQLLLPEASPASEPATASAILQQLQLHIESIRADY